MFPINQIQAKDLVLEAGFVISLLLIVWFAFSVAGKSK
ncbi:hypothetical protein N474_16770 [Pseudoalteromonas luteoviolacea CPMOR-2]|uniref:Uncharacterized protein n=1 Tax=Pseudoalteromonas luteoviolacea DSM 6061 TaxID=1365250 RepID=A0A166UBI6_9GAMM|nr:hypothetical protein N475_05565 [Pseudoalteromonas luteoviolacea DSM 6061]KZN55123.1 hypothetical protein N474_16770 [Pseudoalteromonas luteoviolacea CPMOR-2]